MPNPTVVVDDATWNEWLASSRHDTPEGQRLRRKMGLKRTKWNVGEFIGWDGEGVTLDGRHSYVLLADSTGHQTLSASWHDQDSTTSRTLSTERCLEHMLLTASVHPMAIHVIFAGGYDINMMLQDVPLSGLYRLRDTGRCFYRDYNLRWRPGKCFSVHDRNTDRRIMLWDVFAFFQTSFVRTLRSWNLDDHPKFETIVSEKLRRSVFQWHEREAIREYCGYELELLVTLMGRFHEALKVADLPLTRWDGPGAVAATLFKRHKTHDHQQNTLETVPALNRLAQHAYAGGRIEALRFGNHDGPIYVYDINSAYPAAIAELPSLRHAQWTHRKGQPKKFRPLSLYHVELGDGKDVTSPLFWRDDKGAIHFPFPAEGWYWTPEAQLAAELFPECCRIVEAYEYQPGDNTLPFSWVPELYRLRREWKQQDIAAEKCLKLGLNSLYGKMIQQLGWTSEHLPTYHQLEWGGYVTSATRAKLYRAAFTGLTDVIGFETDSIITTSPLPIEADTELGGWSRTDYDGITYVQPGVYWIRKGDEWSAKFRGIDGGSLSRDTVLNGWRQDARTVPAKLTRFQGLSYSLISEERFEDWCQWVEIPKDIRLAPDTKRWHPPNCEPSCRSGTPADLLHRTEQYGYHVGMSSPYALEWVDGVETSRSDWIRMLDIDEGYISVDLY